MAKKQNSGIPWWDVAALKEAHKDHATKLDRHIQRHGGKRLFVHPGGYLVNFTWEEIERMK